MTDGTITLTVSQLNDYIKVLLDSNEYLYNIYVKGEISNFTNHYKSGHYYFTLKDDTGLLKCVMFKSYAERMKFMPENGMKVVVRGRVSVFTRDGVYQLYAESMEPDGLGALYMAFEQQKKKLEKMGLFDAEHKKALPQFPKRIGIVTSAHSAAAADMLNIIKRRYPVCDILICDSLVQGALAPAELCRGIKYLDAEKSVDLIIIGRGGGSLEDLWAFNDEELAHTIYDASTPVISAVGHETDVTICDFVADLRAPTPSAAAELAVPNMQDLSAYLENTFFSLRSTIRSTLERKRSELDGYMRLRVFSSPTVFLDEKTELLSRAEKDFTDALSKTLDNKRALLSSTGTKLESLSPLSVLSRGYAAVSKNGMNVTRIGDIGEGDEVLLRLSDGSANARIIKISEG